MPKPQPAIIKYIGATETTEITDEQFDKIGYEVSDDPTTRYDYLLSENETRTNTIRFHAIVSEDHKSTVQITKFPIQTGFELSNHAIRKNRIITLEGIISNVVLDNTQQALYEGTSNTSKTVYDTLQLLTNEAIPCIVETNLGIYNPVIFTKLSTRQELGMVDSIRVSISGEEIQVAETISNTGPKELSFTRVTEDRLDSVIDNLNTSGIFPSSDSIISQDSISIGEDFSITSTLSNGIQYATTYIKTGWDGISEYTYEVFTENTDVFSVLDDVEQALQDSLNIPLLPENIDLLGGLDGVTNCLYTRGSEVLVEEAKKVIDTALGELDKSIYGAQQDIIRLGKNELQEELIGTVLDCISVGASDVIGSGNSENVEDVIDEIIVGVKGIGDVAIGGASKVGDSVSRQLSRTLTFTKIEDPNRKPLDKRGVENV